MVAREHLDLETGLNAIANEKAPALIALQTPINLTHRKLNADPAAKRRLLIEEMGVNLEGAEVALHMREQMIAMQRQRLLGRELRKSID